MKRCRRSSQRRGPREAFEAFKGTESLLFEAVKHARVSVKVIDPSGNEVTAVRKLSEQGKEQSDVATVSPG